RRPDVSQLLSGFDVAHGDEDYLAAHAYVRVARVVAEDHDALALAFVERADEEVFGELNLGGAKPAGHRAQRVAVEDVAALDADHLARGDCADGEESLAVNRARADGGFGRDVGQVRHWRRRNNSQIHHFSSEDY